jgi:adenine-specific DNA methylase
VLQRALLEFVAEYANWDLSAEPNFNATARKITEAAHRALGTSPDPRPMVLDPFAGGGAIPLEALRAGADVFASDLNPVAVILNKVVVEYIPKYGDELCQEVVRQGKMILESARDELQRFFPADPDGSTPLAYLWARTIQCEGPGCGARVPLKRSMWLSQRANNRVALLMLPTADRLGVTCRVLKGDEIVPEDADRGTVARGSAICPLCGYTTKVDKVRKQLSTCKGGADTAQLLAVVLARPGVAGRFYREPSDVDMAGVESARSALRSRLQSDPEAVPTEPISSDNLRDIRVPLYGVSTWGDLFTARQALSLSTLASLVRTVPERMPTDDPRFASAVQTVLALPGDRQAA